MICGEKDEGVDGKVEIIPLLPLFT